MRTPRKPQGSRPGPTTAAIFARCPTTLSCRSSIFDFIVVDECHRSIYGLWRQVLEYFDAYVLGLTATPSKQTLGFFHSNLVAEYPYAQSIVDGVNVGYETFRIRTEVSEKGGTIAARAGYHVPVRDRRTRAVRYRELDENLEYTRAALDRSVTAPNQIRTVLQCYRDYLFTKLFPGRTGDWVPKTLIFAKDDAHAEDIVTLVREVFNEGNEFAKKVTYRTQEKPKELIKAFRVDPFPRIAVTVDMIATGTDINAYRMRHHHARREIGRLLRTDERPRCTHHPRRRSAPGHARRPDQDPFPCWSMPSA